MKQYYSQTRPNGKPVEAGTLCYIIDLEDGTPVQATYGKTHEEIIEKLGNTVGHTKQQIERLKAPGPVSVPPAPRLTPDERVQTINDLNDPERAGTAIATLLRDETGFDLRKQIETDFERMGTAWEDAHPDFYTHPGNRRLLMQTVFADNQLRPNELARITPEMLTAAYEKAKARGLLFDAPEPPVAATPAEETEGSQPAPAIPSAFPGNSPVQPERKLYATGTPSMRMRGAAQPPRQTPKYTAVQIKSMNPNVQRQLIETGDKDYAYACDYHFGQQAS